jgi:hypothetical protein
LRGFLFLARVLQWRMGPAIVLSLILVALASAVVAPAIAANPRAEALAQRHAEVEAALRQNEFGRPIALASTDAGGRLRGDVHAVLDHPHAAVRQSMATPGAWCDILVLPFNVKGCQPRGDDGLTLYVGRTAQTALKDAVRIDFRFALTAQEGDYFTASLQAPSGPVGTRDYRIEFEAIPLQHGKTFVHLGYGYGYGTLSKLAMQTYLSTSGASKVGFSRDGEGLVGGMRGVLERNTMRYFLAIDAYLDALNGDPEARAQKRLASWFRETERYPRQLHEMDRGEYLAMKRRDLESPANRLASR